MQRGSRAKCDPPRHYNSNTQGTYQSQKDQNQIQKREQVAPRYCLTLANSCGHQFLFSFPLPFTMAFPFPFCYFQSREPITSHSNTLSTSHPLTIPFRGALALSQRINRAYRQKECLISYHILAPLCHTITIHKLQQQFVGQANLESMIEVGKVWQDYKYQPGLPCFSLLPFSHSFPIKEIACDLSAHFVNILLHNNNLTFLGSHKQQFVLLSQDQIPFSHLPQG